MYTREVKRFLEAAKGSEVFCFDTETTGLSAEKNDIIEFSAIRYHYDGESFKELDSLDIYINPGYTIPEEITQITGITNEKIATDGVSQAEAAERIVAYFGTNPFCMGYNSVSFDQKFVNAFFLKTGHPGFNPQAHLDVLKMARCKMPKPHKLGDMVQAAGLPDKFNLHTSIDDAKATFGVFEFLLTKFDLSTPVAAFEIKTIAPWKRSELLNRIYVNNSLNAPVYYDVAKGCWFFPDWMNEEDAKTSIYSFSKTASDEEFVKKYAFVS